MAQNSDPFFKKIIESLQADEGSSKKNPFRSFVIQNVVLYKRQIKQGQAHLRTCVPESFKDQIFIMYHNDMTSGHLGQTRTLYTTTKRFFWANMISDIINYVRYCPSCQMRKAEPKQAAGLMTYIKVTYPFEKIVEHGNGRWSRPILCKQYRITPWSTTLHCIRPRERFWSY